MLELEENELKMELYKFCGELGTAIMKDKDHYGRFLGDTPVMQVEDALQDRTVVYMGDKEKERDGKPEDLLEIGAHAFFVWLRKRE